LLPVWSPSCMLRWVSDKNVYYAKLAEQAERYDETVDCVDNVRRTNPELSVEERSLGFVAYRKAFGNRRSYWRIITSVMEKQASMGCEEQSEYTNECSKTMEGELDKIGNTILGLLDGMPVPRASNGENKVFYQMMKPGYYRYIAECSSAEAKTKAGPLSCMMQWVSDENVYFAKFEQAERYAEKADYMEKVGKPNPELSTEERSLRSVAYTYAVGSRRAVWRMITSMKEKEASMGSEEQTKHTNVCFETVGEEHDKICSTIFGVLDDVFIPRASGNKHKVFY